MRTQIRQLKKRLIKLEAQAASAEPELDRDRDVPFDFVTRQELDAFIDLYKELMHLYQVLRNASGPSPDDVERANNIVSKIRSFELRSITRREQYPLLWMPLGNLNQPLIAEPWSAEAEIEAIRNEIAKDFERIKGLALDLGALTPDDLTILHCLLKTTNREGVSDIATPNDVQQVLAKTYLVARAAEPIERDKSGLPLKWQDVGRQLTCSDLRLDPAKFPWEKWGQTGRDSSWWRDGGWSRLNPPPDDRLMYSIIPPTSHDSATTEQSHQPRSLTETPTEVTKYRNGA